MDDKVASFLEQVQGLKNNDISVFIPSLQESRVVKELSFKQQKSIISTIADNAAGALKFQRVINDIVVENAGTDELRVTDKLPIILNLRVSALGDEITVDDKIEHLTNCVDAAYFRIDYLKKVSDQGVTVYLSVPTIKQENALLDICIKEVQKDNDQLIGSKVNIIYTYEILKYIDSLEIGETTLDFRSLQNKDKVNIIETLPLSLNKKIVEFIQDIKKKEAERTQTDEGSYFDINVSFFDS